MIDMSKPNTEDNSIPILNTDKLDLFMDKRPTEIANQSFEKEMVERKISNDFGNQPRGEKLIDTNQVYNEKRDNKQIVESNLKQYNSKYEQSIYKINSISEEIIKNTSGEKGASVKEYKKTKHQISSIPLVPILNTRKSELNEKSVAQKKK